MRFIKLVLFLTIATFIADAQVKKQYMSKYSSIGFGGGSSHYFGDMARYSKPVNSLMTLPRWNGTVQYTRYLNPRFMMRMSFAWIRLMGDDYTNSTKWNGTIKKGYESSFLRNANFRNDVKEFAASAIYNLRPQYNRSANQRDRVMPYAFLGFGFYAHDPQTRVRFTEYNADTDEPTKPKPTWVSLKPLATGGQGQTIEYPTPYSSIALVMPMGLGMRWRLMDNLDLTLEGGLRLTPFDYLDDIGSNFANPTDLSTVESSQIPIPAGMLPGTPTPTTANLAQLLSNRTLEVTAARKGKDRTAVYNEIIGGTAPVNGYFFDPSTQQIGYKPDGTKIGSARFSPRWDSYAVIQVSLHFLLNNGVKCPVLK